MSKQPVTSVVPVGTRMMPYDPMPGLLIIGDHSNWLVKVDLATGKVEFGPDYTPDEAARMFWQAISGNCPYR